MSVLNYTTAGPVMDLAVAGMTGWIAGCFFLLFVMTGRGPGQWINLPGYIRWAFIYTGWLMMVRSVNLIGLHDDGEPVPGRANLEAVAVTAGVAYTVTAVTVHLALQRLPRVVWDRLSWLKRELRAHPEQVPVPLSPQDVAEVAHARGAAAIAPGEGAAAVVREAARFHKASRK